MSPIQRGQTLARTLWRPLYLSGGVLFVAMGVIGIFVPVWPTTIFFIMALWAFKRSSPPLEAWLLNHRLFGQTLRDWEESRSMRTRAKVVSISAIWLCLAISCAMTQKPFVWAILGAVGLALTLYLWTRPTAER